MKFISFNSSISRSSCKYVLAWFSVAFVVNVRNNMEHVVSFLQHVPGSSYLGHLTPKSGSAHDISVSILELLQEKNL